MFVVGHRCFDTSLERFDSFSSRDRRGPRGGGHETVEPNREKNDTRLGFDEHKLPTVGSKTGLRAFEIRLYRFRPKTPKPDLTT